MRVAPIMCGLALPPEQPLSGLPELALATGAPRRVRRVVGLGHARLWPQRRLEGRGMPIGMRSRSFRGRAGTLGQGFMRGCEERCDVGRRIRDSNPCYRRRRGTRSSPKAALAVNSLLAMLAATVRSVSLVANGTKWKVAFCRDKRT